jgi:hypothetical protein
MSESHTQLTAPEIASLWTAYLNASMSVCVVGQMLKNIEDPEIKKAIQTTYNIFIEKQTIISEIFQKDNFAVPNGFTNEDVNMDAPKIFSDSFCLIYVNHMSKLAMLAFSGFVSVSVRYDVRTMFTKGLSDVSNLYNQTIELALSKGIYVRAPYIDVPTETDYIDSKKYLGGINPFTKERPLNTIEISHLFLNIQTNSIGIGLCLSFAQTSQNKDVQEYMLRGKDISYKHVQLFTSALAESNLVSPGSPNISITDSTRQTFSEKLMMFHMAQLSAAGTGNYATAAAASQRYDLIVNYERLSVEIGQFAKTGADIMIKNHWLEEPPGMKDREKLARKKES